MTVDRTAQRWIPTGSTRVASKKSPAVAYLFAWAGHPAAVGYFGKAGKPAFHNRFRSVEQRATHIAQWFRNMDAWQQRQTDRRTERNATGRGLSVGDVLVCSWGYDQTNIEYFEVTALVGSTMVEYRPIACETTETAYMQGESVPLPGHYTGEAKRAVARVGRIRIYSFASAYRMEPVTVNGKSVGFKPHHWTAYA